MSYSPYIGMGCTIVLDFRSAFPCTVIEISKNGKEFVCQTDAVDVDAAGNVVWVPNQQGDKTVITLRKNGFWVMKGHKFDHTHVVLGTRNPKLRKSRK